MKFKFGFLSLLILSSLYVTGCTIIKQSVFLQDVNVDGPINQPPLHITSGQKKHSITFSPKIYVNTNKNYTGLTEGHTNVNSSGIFQIDTVVNSAGNKIYRESVYNSYSYDGENLNWKIPDLSVGFQVDIALSDHFAVNGGINYAEINRKKMVNGSVGIGFFTEKKGSAVRFDFGLLFQNTYYKTSSVVITYLDPVFGSKSSEVAFYLDRNKSTSTDLYGSFTYNTVSKKSPVNFYLSLSYFGQTLMDYQPKTVNTALYPFSVSANESSSGKVYASFLSLTPGIYRDISNWGRLSVGVGLLKELSIDNSSRSLFITPLVQLDMLF